ncbi:ABC transporter ATP-binding protein [Streptosporangium sandarakinum]|uniref:ABC transporter ATP-binding protein n=1 Tax=Streptosporangium sandarakinum TaxID=1260955 RepID=UPI003F4D60CE
MTFLSVDAVNAKYDKVHVLHDLSISVRRSETVVILGANGAGKTTLLRSLTGMVPKVTGSIVLDGTELTGRRTEDIVRMGVAHVPQGRGTFAQCTVEENLRLGAYSVKQSKAELRAGMERVYELFPRLGERRGQQAGGMSGGELQMLAIGRALMLRPRLLLLDEPSLGLAPIVIAELFEILGTLRGQETTMLIVEQNADQALRLADKVYLLETGRVVFEGDPETVRSDESIRRVYLGAE